MKTSPCPLCLEEKNFTELKSSDKRTHYLCGNCFLIHTDRRFLPSKADEEKRYLTHKNTLENKGYVNFLMRAITPALPFLNKQMKGLDHGCGPGPVLSELLNQKGIDCRNYDPIFFPEDLRGKFDFIFSTECAEHFFEPAAEIKKIRSLLKENCILTVMTELWTDLDRFGKWYYSRDPTHVAFFHLNSIRYICETFGFEELYNDQRRVFVLKKKG